MSTDRTPQNKVNGNEEVNVDKTVRATNFDFPQNTPSKGEEPDKPLDGTIRIDMPKMEAPKPVAPKPLDGTVRAPGLNQPITPRPAASRPAVPRPAAPRPAAPKALDEKDAGKYGWGSPEWFYVCWNRQPPKKNE